MRHACAAVALLLCAPALAPAQPQTQATVAYTLEFQRYAQGPDWLHPVALPGPLSAPGEGALFRIRMTYSPPQGAPLTWGTIPQGGTSGIGTMAGFWNGVVDLFAVDGASSASGTWSDTSAAYAPALQRRLLPPFAAAGTAGAGTSAAGGRRLNNIQPGQFTPVINGVAADNGVIVWQGLWIPSDLAGVPVITWGLGEDSFNIWSATIAARDQDPDYTVPVLLRANYTFSPPIIVYIAPAPAAAALLPLALAARRRARPGILTPCSSPRRA